MSRFNLRAPTSAISALAAALLLAACAEVEPEAAREIAAEPAASGTSELPEVVVVASRTETAAVLNPVDEAAIREVRVRLN